MATFTAQDLHEQIASRGRGFNSTMDDHYNGDKGIFDSTPSGIAEPAQKSTEGWVIFVNGLLEEHTEGDLLDLFSDFGEVKQLRLPLNRRTGNPHGFALIQYADLLAANEAIESLNGAECIGTTLTVEWAFKKY